MLGVVLAVSRAFIVETGVACEPELALLEVVAHTHWLPRHWRGRAHTREVQGQFEQLFPVQGARRSGLIYQTQGSGTCTRRVSRVSSNSYSSSRCMHLWPGSKLLRAHTREIQATLSSCSSSRRAPPVASFPG